MEDRPHSRRPIGPVIAASLVYVALVAISFVVRFGGNVLVGDAMLLIATVAAWLFSRWYQQRYRFFLYAMLQDASRIHSGGSLSEAESKYRIA